MTTEESTKLEALMLCALILMNERAIVDHGNHPRDNWSWTSVVADSDAASVDLRVRHTGSKQGLWIIDVGPYSSKWNIRKRSLESISARAVADLFEAGLADARKKKSALLTKVDRQSIADEINARAPGCGVLAIVLPGGAIGVEMRCHATLAQVTAMQQAAVACGLGA